ncbi:GNAT family N-acetyltransferase [Chromobacterium violaceum]|uniref:GNAT family N-acetyltransferase n=1 Tax=Chromobacterium violaceum TaxID=536 RepID=UPI0009DA1B22|nr:GNAT family N-acetyltransferase [Chromobacterium violaceum]OQS46501.1 alanine acetyltransferase [Chromobacterium violaceum]OQS49039.1 alanine acetyltransferase [Chromobacterium violaceum]QRO31820.1 GNAT family N-acetyltransferase [Chromobacterium violaceum]QRQ18380.1 GNAT family N-acetyltransferase [Chromobacterium violaceum]
MTVAQPILDTQRLRLLPARPELAAAALDYHLRNRAHLEPWNPTTGPQFYTEAHWAMQLRQAARSWEEGVSARFLLATPAEPERIIGTVSFSNIVRGVFQACHLGYGIDRAREGQGLMREALQAAIAFAFADLKLHRIQANYQPHNVRSAALLQKLGFAVEGQAKDYLFLDGAWRDHVLTSLTNPDFDRRTLLG